MKTNNKKATPLKPLNSNSALGRVRKLFPGVKRIVDAKDGIDIEVTKADTASKAVRNHSECALAHACKRALMADGAIINVTRAYVIKGDTAVRFQLPESISREIVSFDREAGFEAGAYHLDQPSPANRLGNPVRTGSRTYKRGNGKPSKPMHFTGGVRRVGDLNT